jgi:hypothetical protein
MSDAETPDQHGVGAKATTKKQAIERLLRDASTRRMTDRELASLANASYTHVFKTRQELELASEIPILDTLHRRDGTHLDRRDLAARRRLEAHTRDSGSAPGPRLVCHCACQADLDEVRALLGRVDPPECLALVWDASAPAPLPALGALSELLGTLGLDIAPASVALEPADLAFFWVRAPREATTHAPTGAPLEVDRQAGAPGHEREERRGGDDHAD